MHIPQTTQLQLKLSIPKGSQESGIFHHLKKRPITGSTLLRVHRNQKTLRQRITLVYGKSIWVGNPSFGLPGLHLPMDQEPVHTLIPSSYLPALPAYSSPFSPECLQPPISFISLPVSTQATTVYCANLLHC